MQRLACMSREMRTIERVCVIRMGLKRFAAGATAVVTATAMTACGGDESSSAPFVSQKADFTVARQTDTVPRDAFATFTSRSDGKTSAIVDFYVPRTDETAAGLYAISETHGDCGAVGKVAVEVGEASAGITTFVLDETFGAVVGPLRDGGAKLVIAKKGGNKADWCGASENPG